MALSPLLTRSGTTPSSRRNSRPCRPSHIEMKSTHWRTRRAWATKSGSASGPKPCPNNRCVDSPVNGILEQIQRAPRLGSTLATYYRPLPTPTAGRRHPPGPLIGGLPKLDSDAWVRRSPIGAQDPGSLPAVTWLISNVSRTRGPEASDERFAESSACRGHSPPRRASFSSLGRRDRPD